MIADALVVGDQCLDVILMGLPWKRVLGQGLCAGFLDATVRGGASPAAAS